MPPKKVKHVENIQDLFTRSKSDGKFNVEDFAITSGFSGSSGPKRVSIKYNKKNNQIKHLEKVVAEAIFEVVHSKKKKKKNINYKNI